MERHFTLEKSEENHQLPTADHPHESKTIWGYAKSHGYPRATYYVSWSPGKLDELGAFFDIIIGKWGDDSTDDDRSMARLEYRTDPLGFMIVDAPRDTKMNKLWSKALTRDEVINTPLAQELFLLVDEILESDDRFHD